MVVTTVPIALDLDGGGDPCGSRPHHTSHGSLSIDRGLAADDRHTAVSRHTVVTRRDLDTTVTADGRRRGQSSIDLSPQ